MSNIKADKTKVIRVYETFAGIGAQHKAITNIDKTGKHFKVVQTSEWDARAVIAYSQIHHKHEFDKKLIQVQTWDEQKLNKYLFERTFSLNSKVPGNTLRKDLNFKQNLVAASIVNNNYPDINKVMGEQLIGIDLLTYSFPCQGLSIANMGRDKGIKEDAKSTSNLIWQIRRILLDADEKGIQLPKYLLMENVKNLLSKKHMPDYERWLKFLEEIGYTTNTVVLNGIEHGALQKRERVFALSILDKNLRMTNEEFKKLITTHYSNKLTTQERKEKYFEILNSSDGERDEILDAIPKNTKSRRKMAEENNDLFLREWSKNNEWIFNTLTTKQDRHPNVGMITLPKNMQKKDQLTKRFITYREAYQIMGFTSEDFSRVKGKYLEGLITKESLYRQAGNSIVVNVLEDIFKLIKDIEGGKYE